MITFGEIGFDVQQNHLDCDNMFPCVRTCMPCKVQYSYLDIPLLQVNMSFLMRRFLEIIITSGIMQWRRGLCLATGGCTSDSIKNHR